MHPELFLDGYRQNAREVEARLRDHRLASERGAWASRVTAASRVARPSLVAARARAALGALRSARPTARPADPAMACCPA